MTAMNAQHSRHDTDAATIDALTAAGFDGAQYETLISALWRYAWPVMLDMIRTGKIAAIQTKIPHGPIPPGVQQVLHDSAAEREELAHASIARAEPRFKASLKAGHWDPEAGRSLRSYFVGACIQAFWPELSKWRARRRRHVLAIKNLQDNYPAQTRHDLVEDPELQYSRHEAVKLLLHKAKRRSPELEAICIGLQNGMTAAEVADQLGCSSRAVEGRLYQLRKTAWGLVRAGRIDPALVPGSRARIARELARR
jgi:hypothetical protein